MKIILFLLFLPLFAYSQYYVGQLASYASQDNHNLNNSVKSIATDGSVYIYGASSLKKINPNGVIDTSFGTNGVITNVPPISSVDVSRTLIAVNNQNIFLFCNKKLAKYNIDGVIDTTFGNAGFLTLSLGISKMIINDDSSLLVSFVNTYKINKILPNGDISNSFEINNVSGFYKTDLNQIYAISYHTTLPDTLAKYDLSGVKDMNFGTSGSFSYSDYLMLNKKNGEFYLEGSNQLTKYTAGGSIDTSFGTGGTVINNFPFVYKVATDSNNKVLFFGGSQAYNTNLVSIFRLDGNGALDYTFNNGSYLYSGPGGGMITDVLLLDDYTYICQNSTRVSLNSTLFGTAKYVRTLNQSILAVNEQVIVDKNAIIYPNPTSDYINIKINNKKIQKVKIFTMLGSLVLTDYKNKVDVKKLSTGKYLLEVITDKRIYKNQFIKK